MRVHLGSDHAGFDLKRHLVAWLRAEGHEPVDHGPQTYHPDDDYPPFVLRAAAAVVADGGSLGVVVGGSGNGEAMAANKVHGVRAALAWSEETARLGREHNDANVVSLGARLHTAEEATAFVATFLRTPFSGDPRHVRRNEMLRDYEDSGVLPPLPTRGGPAAEG
ncbi:MAG TPA: ribose-5-phosphate isomerase [Mycobacteriales bacterium]|nr:ribose-5-phosphate isomerase [Mycobacteriales bacterium]